MIKLYVKKGCPHCAKVLDALHRDLALDYQALYITNGSNAEEVKKGGKLQVPYLVDEEKRTSLYEADDIVDYLSSTYES